MPGHLLTWLNACCLLLVALVPARAADWPQRPIRFVLGPAPDVLARMVGQKLADAWGQQVVVDQRPGAGEYLGRRPLRVARLAAFSRGSHGTIT